MFSFIKQNLPWFVGAAIFGALAAVWAQEIILISNM